MNLKKKFLGNRTIDVGIMVLQCRLRRRYFYTFWPLNDNCHLE
jgi:hypothetical protein